MFTGAPPKTVATYFILQSLSGGVCLVAAMGTGGKGKGGMVKGGMVKGSMADFNWWHDSPFPQRWWWKYHEQHERWYLTNEMTAEDFTEFFGMVWWALKGMGFVGGIILIGYAVHSGTKWVLAVSRPDHVRYQVPRSRL